MLKLENFNPELGPIHPLSSLSPLVEKYNKNGSMGKNARRTSLKLLLKLKRLLLFTAAHMPQSTKGTTKGRIVSLSPRAIDVNAIPKVKSLVSLYKYHLEKYPRAKVIQMLPIKKGP